MTTALRRTAAALSVLLLVGLGAAACGDEDPALAEDRAAAGAADDETPTGTPPPTTVPAAEGPVRSRGLPTVMDTGAGPELCLGAVAESYPPQCGGPPVEGWTWSAQAPNFERRGDVRWGTFAVTGRWDGTTFTVTDAVPGALYDPAAEQPTEPAEPSRSYTPAELDDIATAVGEDLPGAQGAYAQDGRVLVDVVYDDGSLQEYVDTTYGAGVVVVSGALVDA